MRWISTLTLIIGIAVSFAIGATAEAQVPESLSYQGYLSDSTGVPIDEGVVVEFSIYSVDTGGTALWSEFQSIFPSQGLFSTEFGNAANPLPTDLFDTPLYVGIRVGTDQEMVPRKTINSAPFSMKSKDSETVGGLSAAQLDQSTAVANLTSNLSSTQSDVATIQSDVSSVQSDVTNAQSDISQVQTDLSTAEADIVTVENTLPTLQNIISGSCASGSSIRQVFSNGTVVCENDDMSRWGLSNNNIYYTAGSIGIGTTAPAAAIQIDAPLGVDPFRARVQSSTKLRVHQNGSVSAGTSSAGPDNGLLVSGDALIGQGTSSARLTSTDVLWQFSLDNNDVGGDDWFIGSSATGWAAGGGKFIISPTDSSTNSALLIDSNKDVGIGVTDPLTRLHLGGGSDVTPTGGGYLTVGGSTGANIAIDSNEIMARNNGAATTLALNAEGGEVRINSGGSRDHDSLEVRGRVYFDNGGNSGMRITATNSNPTNALLEPTLYEEALVGSSSRPFWRMYSREFYASSPIEYRTYSDRSIKKDIAPIKGAVATIQALEGVTYALKKHPLNTENKQLTAEEQFVSDNQLGFIAQDVVDVLPQLVTEDEETGLKTVAYMGVIPVLVEALKDQQRQLDAQRIELDELKQRLSQDN